MPSQSRGFWSCDFCKETFDVYEEARYHETEECRHNRPSEQSTPVSSSDLQRRQYQLSTAPLPRSAQKTVLPDYEAERRSSTTIIPLLGRHEECDLDEADAIACQNLELFGATLDHVADLEFRADAKLEIGQIGLRCIHCVNSPLAVAKNGIVFPTCTEEFGDNIIKHISTHLSHCGMVPAPVREISQQASEKRRRAEIEQSSLWQEVARSRVRLRNLCAVLRERYGIINKSASKTGIIFSSPNAHMPPRHIISAERHRDSSSGRPMVMPGQSMMGPIGNDPLAPTPLARRRDRHREAMDPAYSGDRQRGYETPYAQGPPPEGFYEAPDSAATHTPSQLTQRLEEGAESAHATPHAAQPQEASPPAVFHQPPPYEIANNFPFYQEPNGNWSCKFCGHIHPQYRDPQSIWSAPDQGPPPGHFIDQHLSRCRAYHQSMSPQPIYQGLPPPYPPYMAPQYHMSYGPPQPGWEPSSQSTQLHPAHAIHYGHPHMPPHRGPHGGELSHVPPPPYQHIAHQMPHPSKYADAGRGSIMAPARTPPGSAPRSEVGDSAVRHAIDYLSTSDKELRTPGSKVTVDDQLVLEEDRLLLTDYFFYLMKQLRLCRFSESDRKTRGGKREKIKIGFGGLQCNHCADASNSRKFFWSNVDRLANSFAEIPGHVLKCRHCPQQAKESLFQLKQLHPEQMARLPRGSQKVFFRRMWRRLHDGDPEPLTSAHENPEKKIASEKVELKQHSRKYPAATKPSVDISPQMSVSDESALLIQRSSKEAAKALSESISVDLPSSPSSRILLAIPEDKEWLSDTDCFIRRQIEVFCASRDDVATARSDRKYPVHEGQVGIRCIHCALSKVGSGAYGSAVAFPFSISGIYESVREFQRLHLDSCENLPNDVKSRLSKLKGSTSLSSVLRKYYVLAAKALGLQDTRDGIRSGGKSVPLGSQVAFAFAEGNTINGGMLDDTNHRSPAPMAYVDLSPTVTPLESRKRKSREDLLPLSRPGISKKSFTSPEI